jgi:hypothetical protein
MKFNANKHRHRKAVTAGCYCHPQRTNIEMSQIKAFFILLILIASLKSCLVTTAPRYHYLISTNSLEKDSIKVTIFSTPKYKQYVVTNTDLNTQVLIKSPIFENSSEFYLMQNYDFFEINAKQYKFFKRDSKFYRTDDYKRVALKIICEEGEKVINYKVADN